MSDPEKPEPLIPGNDPDPDPGPTPLPPEIGGRTGPEPVRYGDWEKGGIAVDF